MFGAFQNKNDVSSSGFEDNESDTQDSPQNKDENVRKISEIVSACTGRKAKDLELQKSSDLQIESDEEEFYLLKIPKWFKPKDLENTKFSLNKKSKVKTNSEVYRIGPFSDPVKPELFVDKCGLRKITPISILQLEKLEETKDEEYNAEEEKTVKLIPNRLTDRHAIFGAKYEEKISFQEEIKSKIEQAMQRFNLKKKTPKKKKKAPVENEEFDDKSLLISRILEEKLKSKKLDRAAKKASNSHTSLDSGNMQGNIKNEIIIHGEQIVEKGTDNIEELKKKKDKKHSKIQNDSLDQELNKNKMNISSSEIKKEPLSDVDIQENAIEFDSPKKSKKKNRKKKLDEEKRDEIIIHGEQILEKGSVVIEEPQKKKEKKHSRNSEIQNESLDEELNTNKMNIFSSKIKKEPLSDVDIQENTIEFGSPKKSKKKNKKKKSDEEEKRDVKKEIIIHGEQILENETVISEERKKKKEKKHSRNAEIQNESLDQELNTNKMNISISEIKKEPLSDVDIQEDTIEFGSPKKSKKKNKKKKSDEEEKRNVKKEIIIHGEQILEKGNVEMNNSKNSEIQNESLDLEMSKNKINISAFEIKKEPVSDLDTNEFESPKKSKKNTKLDEDENQDISIAVKKELMSETEHQGNPLEKRKKKRRRESEHSFLSPGQECDDFLMPPSKKSRPSILSSTVLKEASPEFKPDVSAIENEMNVSKKKNKKKKEEQDTLIEGLLSEVRNNLESPKKKKHKKSEDGL